EATGLENIVRLGPCRVGVMTVVLVLALFTAGREAPALEKARPMRALGGDLGPAPRAASGIKTLDPNLLPASSLTRTRLAVLGLFSLIRSPRHFEALPAGAPDTAALWSGHDATATWIGHSTVLVQLDGLNILTDPNWSSRTGPLSG